MKKLCMLSVTILTKNCQDTLAKTLDSLKNFPEVLVYDTGSTDQTLSIAALYPNVRVVKGIFQGFGPTHNSASQLASQEWILSIDSDEVLSEELVQEIFHLTLDPSHIYQIDRRNYFNGKWIKGCGGWYPDPVIRLYNRTATQFSGAAVHEKILVKNLSLKTLKGPLFHTPYRSIDDFLLKMQTYSTLFAEQNRGKKKASLLKALLHSWSAFLKSYLFKKGIFQGKEGLIISLYNAHTTFYKYLKISDLYPIGPRESSRD